jgi:exopolyphosphatase / guanosine-5'-triphosphate,3'-diphosphate pyrophosphatase
MALVRVGVIDVGANTLRLLVVATDGARIVPVHTERAQLGLGEHVESAGRLSEEVVAAAVKAARRETRRALSLGCSRVRIVVTSPGRQAANGLELVAALAAIPGATAQVLDAEEEARFAFVGAVGACDVAAESLAVCDVGGGSVQIVVGTREAGPVWSRSLDIGSLRLAHRHLTGETPGNDRMRALREEAERGFTDLAPPLPQAALATGGSARALRKLVGRVLAPAELGEALELLAETSPKKLAKEYGLTRARARTLPAGAILLAEAQRRLGVPLTVARGGVREGVALTTLSEAVAA